MATRTGSKVWWQGITCIFFGVLCLRVHDLERTKFIF